MISPQLMRFLMVGGIAAGANFCSRFVFSSFFSFGIAVFLAYLVGMLVAFVLMRENVFNASQQPLVPQVTKFIGINVLAVLQTLAISLLLTHWLLPSIGFKDHAEALGHLVGMLVPVITSYFGHKLVTFR